MDELLAKSQPVETVNAHTEGLLENFNLLKAAYGSDFEVGGDWLNWDLIELAATYHDVGKINPEFQAKLFKSLNRAIPNHNKGNAHKEIPHNYLSYPLIPKNKLDKFGKYDQKVLANAILFHHERKNNPFDKDMKSLLKRYYEGELLDYIQEKKSQFNWEIELNPQRILLAITQMPLQSKRIRFTKEDSVNYYKYIFTKGLLHRLDYAASAHEYVEINLDEDYEQSVENFFVTNKYRFNDLQQTTKSKQQENLIVIAQTGMGKTEAALLWAGKRKTFFTLPLRVSLNSQYQRAKNMHLNCGLLHSTAEEVIRKQMEQDPSRDEDEIYSEVSSSRLLSHKLTFTTIDQILKIPFKYLGYERIYATLAYSNLIIDEIQAYNPKLVAVIIRSIEMVSKIGGRFLIMTATMPQIYLDKLLELELISENQIHTFVDDNVIRHRFKLYENTLAENIDDIIVASKNRKVLVIVNTIKVAQGLYLKIKQHFENVHILHANYVGMHRQRLENEIQNFAQAEDAQGIWITTQIVEASIDIDFDELYTEMSTLDSLFQRCGRCYRRREYKKETPNIHIFYYGVSGRGYIYDQEIFDYSVQLLQRHSETSDNALLESQKIELVRELYSQEALAGTNFLTEFQESYQQLVDWPDYEGKETEAQRYMRDNLNSQILVMPLNIYNNCVIDWDGNPITPYEVVELFNQTHNKNERKQLRNQLLQCTMTISEYSVENPSENLSQPEAEFLKVLPTLKIINSTYEFDESKQTGIGLKKKGVSEILAGDNFTIL